MKMIVVNMKNGDKFKTVFVNADKIECLIPVENGCRILFPYLSQDGDICRMEVTESASELLEQMV